MNKKTVYIIFMPGYGVDGFYNYSPKYGKSFDYQLREEIEKAGFNVKFVSDTFGLKDVAAIISWDLNQPLLNSLAQHPPKKCILLTFEPPVVAPSYYHPNLQKQFGTIFTLIDNLVDNKTYFKIYLMTSRLKRIENVADFSTKKYCCLINNNKMYHHPGELYSERKKAIAFFSKTGEFNLYGAGWAGISSWRGEARDDAKFDVLKNHKFTICFENMTHQRGYISEKIIEAFAGGCVPIYFGATNIEDYVPRESFIDFRKFHSYQHLHAFMKSVDQNSYQSYLNAGECFLQSPQSLRFHSENIVKNVMDRILWAQT
ncbi:MAG: hypothetical protein HW387_988 [Parachlamydiales bacterium]|nr:hypothetical protein [Parachlamydiales bacterium]